MPKATLHVGDAKETLSRLPESSVQCCVTSPPYWGLRSYLDSDDPKKHNELGAEETPEEYVSNLCDVFDEVRRVLRSDGTLWLNLGDTYSDGGAGPPSESSTLSGNGHDGGGPKLHKTDSVERRAPGLDSKQLVGIPWRVALALQDEGWYLRSDIIWNKPNPMPESVTDRPTSSHEHIFLLSRGDKWTGAVEPVPMTGEEASWLAALVDGEGTLTIAETSNGGYQAMISVANSDRSLLERSEAITGMGNVCTSSLGENKEVYRWQVSSRQAASIVYRLRDKLMAKRKQAHVLLNLQETHKRYGGNGRPDHVTRKQKALYEKIKALNSGENAEVSENKARWRGNQYYYDHEAVREPAAESTLNDNRFGKEPDRDYDEAADDYGEGTSASRRNAASYFSKKKDRNKRDVWTVSTKPYPEAHFAVYPPDLIEPCIEAGSAEGDTVLDPFAGAGTTGLVALAKGRDFTGIDLSRDYTEMAADRIRQDAPLMNDVEIID